MSHHHHDHDHSDHQHGHHHGHSHDHSEMTFNEKIAKLLDHWIQHNNDHAESYQGWAAQATENNLEAVAGLIQEAADMNLAINEKFEKAKALIAGADNAE